MKNENWAIDAQELAARSQTESLKGHALGGTAMVAGVYHMIGSGVSISPDWESNPNLGTVIHATAKASEAVNENIIKFAENIASMDIPSPIAQAVTLGIGLALAAGGLIYMQYKRHLSDKFFSKSKKMICENEEKPNAAVQLKSTLG